MKEGECDFLICPYHITSATHLGEMRSSLYLHGKAIAAYTCYLFLIVKYQASGYRFLENDTYTAYSD
jgi:hypothetical protein